MEVGFAGEAAGEVEIFVDAVPVLFINSTFGEGIEGGTLYDLHICYHEAWVMGGQMIVNRSWKDSIAVIEEDDQEKDS